jgi:hypothetical protein
MKTTRRSSAFEERNPWDFDAVQYGSNLHYDTRGGSCSPPKRQRRNPGKLRASSDTDVLSTTMAPLDIDSLYIQISTSTDAAVGAMPKEAVAPKEDGEEDAYIKNAIMQVKMHRHERNKPWYEDPNHSCTEVCKMMDLAISLHKCVDGSRTHTHTAYCKDRLFDGRWDPSKHGVCIGTIKNVYICDATLIPHCCGERCDHRSTASTREAEVCTLTGVIMQHELFETDTNPAWCWGTPRFGSNAPEHWVPDANYQEELHTGKPRLRIADKVRKQTSGDEMGLELVMYSTGSPVLVSLNKNGARSMSCVDVIRAHLFPPTMKDSSKQAFCVAFQEMHDLIRELLFSDKRAALDADIKMKQNASVQKNSQKYRGSATSALALALAGFVPRTSTADVLLDYQQERFVDYYSMVCLENYVNISYKMHTPETMSAMVGVKGVSNGGGNGKASAQLPKFTPREFAVSTLYMMKDGMSAGTGDTNPDASDPRELARDSVDILPKEQFLHGFLPDCNTISHYGIAPAAFTKCKEWIRCTVVAALKTNVSPRAMCVRTIGTENLLRIDRSVAELMHDAYAQTVSFAGGGIS